ncbi:6-phosphofructokinase [Poseidonocella pacifica]|uniref:Phosphofructokinase n=1 Tax=Poseidonocella pacifica TaxID=871651 RepID=A0A1I0XJI3_9RHOB|nr:1-phosphofructokinase family hexose kinase [Poseidonocella pacifica]SFB01151.1 6-phosphofructokinase [Poseidonocella pacifica]
MRPIVTLTLNPALDLSSTAAGIVPDRKLRCTAPRSDPGGGGINVARAIKRLGGEATAFAALGGPTGARMAELLAAEGISCRRYEAPGETRMSLAVRDTERGGQYRFVLPGPEWTPAAEDALLADLGGGVPEGALVVLSGSQPPGISATFPARLAAVLGGRDLLVDTSGAPMLALREARAPLFALRLDGQEASEMAGRAITSVPDLAQLAAGLVAECVAAHVILALGAEGSVLASRGAEGAFHARPPRREVVSAVGAGDSFMGGFAQALAMGQPPEEALRLGTAAACAAVMSDATELCSAEDVAAILPEIVLARP